VGRPQRPPTEQELVLADKQAELAAAQISARYTPPEHGGWSEIGDPLIIRTLLEGIALGLKNHDACQAAGIYVGTLTRWLKRAEAEPESAYAALAEAMKSARAKGKAWHLANIQRHSVSEWTASAWTLERTDPEQFALRKETTDGPKVIVQIGAGSGDVQVNVVQAGAGSETLPASVETLTLSPSLSLCESVVSAER
jgi:hypothetical protein